MSVVLPKCDCIIDILCAPLWPSRKINGKAMVCCLSGIASLRTDTTGTPTAAKLSQMFILNSIFLSCTYPLRSLAPRCFHDRLFLTVHFFFPGSESTSIRAGGFDAKRCMISLMVSNLHLKAWSRPGKAPETLETNKSCSVARSLAHLPDHC